MPSPLSLFFSIGETHVFQEYTLKNLTKCSPVHTQCLYLHPCHTAGTWEGELGSTS